VRALPALTFARAAVADDWAKVLETHTLARLRHVLKPVSAGRAAVQLAATTAVMWAGASVGDWLRAALGPLWVARVERALGLLAAAAPRPAGQPFAALAAWLAQHKQQQRSRRHQHQHQQPLVDDATTSPVGFDVPLRGSFDTLVFAIAYAHARAVRGAAHRASAARGPHGDDDDDNDVNADGDEDDADINNLRRNRHPVDVSVEFRLAHAVREFMRAAFVNTGRRGFDAALRDAQDVFAALPPDLRTAAALLPRDTRDRIAIEFAVAAANGLFIRHYDLIDDGVYAAVNDAVVRASVPIQVRAASFSFKWWRGPAVALGLRKQLAAWRAAGCPATAAGVGAGAAVAVPVCETDDVVYLDGSAVSERLLESTMAAKARKASAVVVRVVVPGGRGSATVHVPVKAEAGKLSRDADSEVVTLVSLDPGGKVPLQGALLRAAREGVVVPGDDDASFPTYGEALVQAHHASRCERAWMAARVGHLARHCAGNAARRRGRDRMQQRLGRQRERAAERAKHVRRSVADGVVARWVAAGVQLVLYPRFSFHSAAARRRGGGGVRSETRALFAAIGHAELRQLVVGRARRHGIVVRQCAEWVCRARARSLGAG
jgi:hypothetical protein